MDEFKPNSHRSKEQAAEHKKVEKVVSGTVKVKKKTEPSKFKDVFLAEDVGSVKNHILMDVLVPAMKKVVVDMFQEGIERLVYGESARGKKGNSNVSYVSYNRYSDKRDDDRFRSNETRKTAYSYDEIIFETRGEAEKVLATMDDIIDEYDFVTVFDLYELSGLSGPYTGQQYGWSNLRDAEAIRVRDGYTLRLPKARTRN